MGAAGDPRTPVDAERDDAARIAQLAELLPRGVAEIARAWRDAGSALLGQPVDPDPSALLRDLVLPLLVEPDWPRPSAPVAVKGGWVQADLIHDDRDSFERLRRLHPHAGPEGLSAAAQEWRLPVVPYRKQAWRVAKEAACVGEGEAGRHEGTLDGVKVVDLTSLWAGPLATRLLADAGASVTKIDPACRPDGFRQRSALYRELNAGKQIIDLDLGDASDRHAFEALVADADLLVDSFSRRVLPNFGYGRSELRALNPRASRISIVGFPRGCVEQDWLAYGTGIHAVSGHGMSTGQATATPVAWPDPLSGYAAFARALEVLGSPSHVEISLVSSAAAVSRAARGPN